MTNLPPLNPRWQDLETLERYDALPEPDRHALAAAIAAALGPDYALGPDLLGTRRLGAVHHAPTDTTFAIIPGGEFDMGVRPEERDELVAAINTSAGEEQDGEIDRLLEAAQPVHLVKVRPFLLAVSTLLVKQGQALSAELAAKTPGVGMLGRLEEPLTIEPHHVPGVLAGAPREFRLPCEAEWEWVAREGGSRSWVMPPRAWLSFEMDESANAFGVFVIADFYEYAADAWFPNHEGAPEVAVARDPGPEPGVLRGAHGGWQDAIEAVVTACGYRQQADATSNHWLRFACDLP